MTETIGAALKRAREERRLSLAQVSETTKIRSHYLQALENDDISAVPSTAQARGFLRIYADFLGLDLSKLVPAAPPVQAMDISEATPAQEKGPARQGLLERLRERLPRRASKAPEPTPVESATSDSPKEAAPFETNREPASEPATSPQAAAKVPPPPKKKA